MQNLSANHLCFRCKAPLEQNRPFCGNCGIQQPRLSLPMPKKKGSSALGIIIIVLIGLLFASGILYVFLEEIQKQKKDKQQPMVVNAMVTPTVMPELTNDVKLQRAKDLILGSQDETQLNKAKTLISSIPKEAKEYKEAQKQSAIIAVHLMELALIGERPTTAPARAYLRNNLNDYDSSEFIEWSPVSKTYIKNEPYWSLSLKLRAKNLVGAYLLKDVTFYIRQNQVMKTDGL